MDLIKLLIDIFHVVFYSLYDRLDEYMTNTRMNTTNANIFLRVGTVNLHSLFIIHLFRFIIDSTHPATKR